MTRVRLHEIAHGRAGDKGNVSNISVIAYRPEHWPAIAEQVTAERVLEVFGPHGATGVDRYELPNLHALNFVIHDALGGGVNASLSLDRHGKCLSYKLLGEVMVEIEPPP
ncbi:hypothetical protein KHP62_06140 [Rhodobacteraceae bacterium NNCM2]|nr:hypothetical protein [Coraliihabitans acroporae]